MSDNVYECIVDGHDATWYYHRGRSMAEKGQGSLFRKVRGELVPEGEGGDEWEQWKREAYMQGYEAGM